MEWVLFIALVLCILLLGMGFVRELRIRLQFPVVAGKALRRIDDYNGRPLKIQNGDNGTEETVLVEEIFHYGNEYFVKGHHSIKGMPQVYRLNKSPNQKELKVSQSFAQFLQLL